ncbi:MAG: ABC transporter substrate-binding protein, partial [Lachnospiraceae bacterium]|nr:ABC transporter substrate-binding protein [Lachnospiraceae bacterium]
TARELKIEDGTYYIDVDLEGGSGKASVESPALLLIQDGEAAAMITWSSSNYDYMVVDDMKFDADVVDDKSTFVIPVKGFDYRLPVIADTTAMSRPYEIEYTLFFDSATIRAADPESVAPAYSGMKIREKIKPEYATGFTIDSYDNNIYRVTVGKDRYLLVPRLTELPVNIPDSVTVIRTPVSRAYVASTSSMDYFTQLEALKDVAFTSSEASKWTDERVSSLVEADTIHYVGRYDAPDYESLITGKADIAVENTMIYHTPETEEKLKEISVPVFVDKASYEDDPRGRVEWIKVYGILTGEYGRAVRFFDAACKRIDEAAKAVGDDAGTSWDRPKVAYFYISPKGHVGVRKPGDYISKMIEIAGGEYIPSDIKVPKDGDKSSAVDMSMEDFYLKVKDADILIYNGTLYGIPESVEKLVSDTALLSEFKAVKEGRVYASEDIMFQATCEAADIIEDLAAVMDDKASGLTYFSRIERDKSSAK